MASVAATASAVRISWLDAAVMVLLRDLATRVDQSMVVVVVVMALLTDGVIMATACTALMITLIYMLATTLGVLVHLLACVRLLVLLRPG